MLINIYKITLGLIIISQYYVNINTHELRAKEKEEKIKQKMLNIELLEAIAGYVPISPNEYNILPSSGRPAKVLELIKKGADVNAVLTNHDILEKSPEESDEENESDEDKEIIIETPLSIAISPKFNPSIFGFEDDWIEYEKNFDIQDKLKIIALLINNGANTSSVKDPLKKESALDLTYEHLYERFDDPKNRITRIKPKQDYIKIITFLIYKGDIPSKKLLKDHIVADIWDSYLKKINPYLEQDVNPYLVRDIYNIFKEYVGTNL